MVLSLHGYDGRDVHIDPSSVASISQTHLGGRVCTRIGLRSGADVVVNEPESVVRELLVESRR